MVHRDEIEELRSGLTKGNVRALSRAITLVESQRKEDQDGKVQLLRSIQNMRVPSVKIGITGSPGVGKSTFINACVSRLGGSSHRIAVLTIDPSSKKSGGSILGDKLRMTDLVHMEEVYVRPSPSKGVLGGINLTTWETIQLCEAAGYDFIFVETVGIGQSELEVKYLVNEVWYLTMARSGDEIQGIKRGILEVVDRVIVTKSDIDPHGSRRTAAMLQQTVRSIHPEDNKVEFYEVSALNTESLNSLMSDLLQTSAQPWSQNQQRFWFDRAWQEVFLTFLESNPAMKDMYHKKMLEVESGQTDHWSAIDSLKTELQRIWSR